MNDKVRIYSLFSGFIVFALAGMWFSNLWLILTAFITLAVLIYWNHLNDEERIEKIIKEFNTLINENEYNNLDHFQGEDGLSGIVLDEMNNELVIFKRSDFTERYSIVKLPFLSLIESNLSEDGVTITKTSRGSQIGGALIGGALAGGIGAVVGGLGAPSSSSNHVKKLTLQIVSDNLKEPIQNITFFTSLSPTDKQEEHYVQLSEKAMKWHKRISVILKKNELNIESSRSV
jgi:gas vesicle protein